MNKQVAIGVPIDLSAPETHRNAAVAIEKPQDILDKIQRHQQDAKELADRQKLQQELEWSRTVDQVYAAIREKLQTNNGIRSTDKITRLTVYGYLKTSMYGNNTKLKNAINTRFDVDYQGKLACSLRARDEMVDRCCYGAGWWICMTCVFCCVPMLCYRCIERKRMNQGTRYRVDVELTMDPTTMEWFKSRNLDY